MYVFHRFSTSLSEVNDYTNYNFFYSIWNILSCVIRSNLQEKEDFTIAIKNVAIKPKTLWGGEISGHNSFLWEDNIVKTVPDSS